MRYAILSDIHANLEALEAVLADAGGQSVDAYYCLGDVVGYGADPGACVERIRDLCVATVAGNHDHAAIDKTSTEYFNSEARAAVIWTRDHLAQENKDWLDSLPLTHDAEAFQIVHSTLHGPELFNYVLNPFDAMLCFQHLTSPVCFIGHSHAPLMYSQTSRIDMLLETDYALQRDERAIVNVGSVGQPRDQDARASYAVYDADARIVNIRRVRYDTEAAADKIDRAGLPQTNALRLLVGR